MLNCFINKELNLLDWDFKFNESSSLSSIHPYPAKFIPEIPGNLIDLIGLPKNTCVCDPFCGSGTTLVEAQKRGYRSIGVDLNPIGCLISRVKTNPIGDNFIRNLDFIVNYKRTKEQTHPIPNVNHWFKPEIQIEIERLRNAINLLENKYDKDFFNLVLSSIIVSVSNQESDTRYAAIEKHVTTEIVTDKYINSSNKIHHSLINRNYLLEQTTVINKNLFDVVSHEFKMPVGLVVTSPPYPNAYEYWLYHKYRMYWLGYDPLFVKQNEIGARAHFFKKNHHTKQNFVEQMKKTFSLLDKIVVENGHICFVVGRSIIHGEEIDNAEIIIDTAKLFNLHPTFIKERAINSNRKSFNLSYANIKKETILVFGHKKK